MTAPRNAPGPGDDRRPLVVDFQDNRLLPRLFGEHDIHLARIERALGVSVSSRGNRIAISGDATAAAVTRHALRDLYRRLESGHDITPGDVDGAIRLAEAAAGEDMPAASPLPGIRTGRRSIVARSAAQAAYLDALGRNELVFGLGPAGTGKTYLAVAVAVAMLLDRRVDRLVLSRPAVEAGERLGFLPGDMKEKVDPYLRPLYDALHDMMPPGEVTRRLENGDIEVAPLAFMRGRTLANSFVILDEAQNTTSGQMKMFLTRLGENGRMAVTGDPSQIDLPPGVRSGLTEAVETLSGVPGIGFCHFGEGDVVRHPLVSRIVRAYRLREEGGADMAATSPAPEGDVSDLQRARALLSATAIRALAEDHWTRWRPWLDAPLFAGLIVLLTLIFAPAGQSVRPIPPLDSIADETVRAERAVAVEDRVATEARRAAAAEASLPVFGYDPDLYLALAKRVTMAVDDMASRAKAMTLAPAQRRAAFQEAIGRPVPQATFDILEKLENPNDLATAVNYLLNLGLDRMIIADRDLLPVEGPIQVAVGGRDRLDKALVAGVMDVGQFRRLIQARAGDAPYGTARAVRSFVLETALALVAPNLEADPARTAQLRDKAVAAVEPVMVRLAIGEVVIREGDRVTKLAQDRLRLLNEGGANRSVLGETLAVGALILGLTLLAGNFFRAGRQGSYLGRKQIYITLATLAGAAFICVAAWYAGRGVAAGLGVPADAAAFLPPVALATVIVALVIDARTSLLVGVGLALLVAYRVGGDLWVLAHYLVGVLAAGMTARRGRRRADILKLGLVIAGAQLVLVPIMVALDTTVPADQMSYFVGAAVAGAVGALLIAAFTTAGLPLLEWVFDETTDMRLLELASADNPLLKQLALRSPGTYYHSVMMANLAETAAEAVGANGLQARVMALYHDLGKMERPSYFAENQRGTNIHDRLPPELSARIIFAHIKDGIDIARKHRLGRPVLDAITQHQGTTLLRVFHQRALERASAAGETVNEAEFRYPGPRPMTKESGILMLADTVEAATRALKDPKPAEVRERVARVIAEKIADHQLDDCALTMKDLAAIEAAFVRVLTLGVYHSRIEYPPLAPPKKEPTPERRHDDANTATGEPPAHRPSEPTPISAAAAAGPASTTQAPGPAPAQAPGKPALGKPGLDSRAS